MKCSSKQLLIIIFLFLSWTKSLSLASKEVSSVIHPFVRVLDGQQCSTTTVDSNSGEVGLYTSLQLNTSGNAVISYRDETNDNLMLAICNDAACSSPTITIVDGATNDVGQFTSLQLNTSGNAVISYFDVINKDLMLAVCNDAVCSNPTITKVDGTNRSVGRYTSLQLNKTSGNAVISYYDSTNGDLMLAVCNDAACSNPTITKVDGTNADVGMETSLQLNTSGNAVISYYDSTNRNLMLAICNDAVCSNPTITKVDDNDTNVGQYNSLQLNASGNAVISYHDFSYGYLMLAICNDAVCSNPTITKVDDNGTVGRYTSLQLNASGNAVISYFDVCNGDLMLAVCNDAVCSNPTITAVDGTNDTNVGQYSSLQLNKSGNAVISYHDFFNANLMLSSCTIATISEPSGMPSMQPSHQPSLHPSAIPSMQPSHQPSHQPSISPSGMPSLQPSSQPSLHPSAVPSMQPSHQPSHQPSISPSGMPSLQPSSQPSLNPSAIPSLQPRLHPSHQSSKSKDKRKKTKAKKRKAEKPTTPKVGKKVQKSRKKAHKKPTTPKVGKKVQKSRKKT